MEQFIKSNIFVISKKEEKQNIKKLFKCYRKNIYFFVTSKKNENNSINISNKINLNISSDSKDEKTFLRKKRKFVLKESKEKKIKNNFSKLIILIILLQINQIKKKI